MKMVWKGVMPATTTCFDTSLKVDYGFVAEHGRWLVDNGCTGIVTPGSLGEGATLSLAEKLELVRTYTRALENRAPVVAAVSALSTEEAVSFAKQAADAGATALMVLPAYVYLGDWRETREHISAIFRATKLSCMLYNNPIAYVTDFLPEQMAQLAMEHANFEAVKESSGDVRRVTAIRALLGTRLAILCGVDDVIVEGAVAGAVGWVAGLASALPRESVDLFNYAANGEMEKAFELYRWFLPLLRMDVVPKFVQLIKLVQQEVGMGNARVRPPRLELVGAELEEVLKITRHALATRPAEAREAALQNRG